MTGGLASNGKAILAAYQMWEEDINAKGGILGRPVKLIYYDDHSNPSLVPAIYAKLFDVDKIDLAFTSYGTVTVVTLDAGGDPARLRAAGAVCARREQRVQLPLLLLHVQPGRCRARSSRARVFREIAKEQKLQTVAIAGAGCDFAEGGGRRARERDKLSFKIVYDRGYPPNTVDFTPIVRGIQASNPDFVYIASYRPTETLTSCARQARSVSRPSCSAAAWSACNMPSRTSSASCSTRSSTTTSTSPNPPCRSEDRELPRASG